MSGGEKQFAHAYMFLCLWSLSQNIVNATQPWNTLVMIKGCQKSFTFIISTVFRCVIFWLVLNQFFKADVFDSSFSGKPNFEWATRIGNTKWPLSFFLYFLLQSSIFLSFCLSFFLSFFFLLLSSFFLVVSFIYLFIFVISIFSSFQLSFFLFALSQQSGKYQNI